MPNNDTHDNQHLLMPNHFKKRSQSWNFALKCLLKIIMQTMQTGATNQLCSGVPEWKEKCNHMVSKWSAFRAFTVDQVRSRSISGEQDPGFGVQSGRIFGFFLIWTGLDIVFLSTGSGLSKWNKIWPCKKSWYGI